MSPEQMTGLRGLFRAGRRAVACAGFTRGTTRVARLVVATRLRLVATRLRLVAAWVTLAGAGATLTAALVVAWVALLEGREACRDGLPVAFCLVALAGVAFGRPRRLATGTTPFAARIADTGRTLARLTHACGAGDHAARREQQPIFQRLEGGHWTHRQSRLLRAAAGGASIHRTEKMLTHVEGPSMRSLRPRWQTTKNWRKRK
jgi:hypothetical protein